jgi:hypothetical protein
MPARVIDARARNRALLARQMLLTRVRLAPVRAVERLVGMQAQTPRSPYTALWSRLIDFDPFVLSRAIETGKLVRIAVMRSTIHLVTPNDAMLLRPLVQPVLDRELTSPVYRAPLAGVDLDELARVARKLLTEEPRTPKQLGAALSSRWPQSTPQALAHAARTMLPLVQLPPRALWQRSGTTTLATADQWVGTSLRTDASWDEVALRYLGAFGPATAADFVTWSRVPGMAEVFARLRPRLRVLHDPDGRELLDLPRAPRPPASTPAPPRFLPDYDNVLLSHADRNHVIRDEHRSAMQRPNGVLPGTLLVDGSVQATWSLVRDGTSARLVVRALEDIAVHRDAIRDEGRGLLALLAADAARTEVVFA